MLNKIRFVVGGITYSIMSEDSAEYIESLGRELDHKMDALAKQNPFLSTTMTATSPTPPAWSSIFPPSVLRIPPIWPVSLCTCAPTTPAIPPVR